MRVEDMVVGQKYRRIVIDWNDNIKIGTVLTLVEIVYRNSVRFAEFPKITLMPKFFEPVEEGAARAEGVKAGMKLKRVKNYNPEEWDGNRGVDLGDIVTVKEIRLVHGKHTVSGFRAEETGFCYSLADFEIAIMDAEAVEKQNKVDMVDAMFNAVKKQVEEDEDVVNHPKHYTSKNGVECIQVTEQFNFNKGNAIKYIWRSGEKNPTKEVEDLAKAKWYIEREIERLLKK
jgi:hypothetical protein